MMGRGVGSLAAMTGLLLCVACASGASHLEPPLSDGQAQDDDILLQAPPAQANADQLFVLNGQGVDVANRYLSTVVVTTDEPMGMCSGVLINPRLVLTAGHCVCMKQEFASPAAEQAGAVIDNSKCVDRAYVTVALYKSTAARMQYVTVPKAYAGVVRPHGELKILLDRQGNVMTSRADLALIRLDKPVAGDGFRRYGRNTVTQVMSQEEGLFLMEKDGAHSYAGDSGGPCFREDKERRWLVGISTRGTGRVSKFTSTFRYKSWLNQEIKLAAKSKT